MTHIKSVSRVILIRLNSQLLNTFVVLVKRDAHQNWQPSQYFRAWAAPFFLDVLCLLLLKL